MKIITSASDLNKTPDVCIIGSGAAGCVLAHDLSENGLSIVVLEKGSYYTIEQLKEIKSEEVLSSLWKNRGVFLTRNFSVNIGQGQCVGGSTMINYGICFEIPDDVFYFWKVSFGIKFSKSDFDEAFELIRQKMPIVTLTPGEAGDSHKKLADGCEKLGYASGWMEKAYDRNKKLKQSARTSYLDTINSQSVEIFPNCAADGITVEHKIATKVVAYESNDKDKKKPVTLKPKVVIIAAGPVASSEILLRNKLANSNGQVGKHLSLHPSTSVVAVFPNEDINGDNDMAMAYYCNEFSVHKTHKPGFMIESVFVPPSQFSIAMPSFGKKNREYVTKYNQCAMAGILVHDEPSGTITLNLANNAVVDYDLSKDDQQKMLDGIKETARIFFRAGAEKIITGHIRETVLRNESELRLIDKRGAGMGSLQIQSVHPQGGNRMGEDPSNSVVNSYCKTHEYDNLYVCDASVFPTSVGVNPQFTVMAIATITAKKIIENHFS